MIDLSAILDRIPDHWGRYVQVGPGWHSIVLELDAQLNRIDPTYEVHQVKEKFGGLRYYCSLDGDDKGAAHIRDAERKASETCEQCGRPGKLRSGGWLKTLCEECHKP